ncbi:hypothetical protein F5H01DRAFT_385507 [Linnemannia elongata]|nr:hypothetical protein F5H01DRAFT_385507 [Linnemannia elongata]
MWVLLGGLITDINACCPQCVSRECKVGLRFLTLILLSGDIILARDDFFRSWTCLYRHNASSFNITQLGEAFWDRMSWSLIMEQLDDIDEAFMIDGEKSGLGSTRRRNSGRALNNDGYVERKRIGRKMDLVARDITRPLD